MQRKRTLWRRRETSSVDTLRVKESIPHQIQESPLGLVDNTHKFTPSTIKHRYFYLSDSSPIYDLKAKSIEKVGNMQDVMELQTLAKSFEVESSDVLVKKVSEHLDTRISELREDRKRMQLIRFHTNNAVPAAPDAFKALKAENQLLVMELVIANPSLTHAIDSVLLTIDRTNASALGDQTEVPKLGYLSNRERSGSG
jgi:hypothetical protein